MNNAKKLMNGAQKNVNYNPYTANKEKYTISRSRFKQQKDLSDEMVRHHGRMTFNDILDAKKDYDEGLITSKQFRRIQTEKRIRFLDMQQKERKYIKNLEQYVV